MSAPFVVCKYDLQRNALRHARFCMARNVARELNVVVTVEMPQQLLRFARLYCHRVTRVVYVIAAHCLHHFAVL